MQLFSGLIINPRRFPSLGPPRRLPRQSNAGLSGAILSADELPREAFGVRGACWRCREVWGGSKAGASSTHSKRFAQFDCGFAVLCLKCRHEA